MDARLLGAGAREKRRISRVAESPHDQREPSDESAVVLRVRRSAKPDMRRPEMLFIRSRATRVTSPM